jgi:hypothetical protein
MFGTVIFHLKKPKTLGSSFLFNFAVLEVVKKHLSGFIDFGLLAEKARNEKKTQFDQIQCSFGGAIETARSNWLKHTKNLIVVRLSVESSSVSVPSCLWCTMTFFFVSR